MLQFSVLACTSSLSIFSKIFAFRRKKSRFRQTGLQRYKLFLNLVGLLLVFNMSMDCVPVLAKRAAKVDTFFLLCKFFSNFFCAPFSFLVFSAPRKRRFSETGCKGNKLFNSTKLFWQYFFVDTAIFQILTRKITTTSTLYPIFYIFASWK